MTARCKNSAGGQIASTIGLDFATADVQIDAVIARDINKALARTRSCRQGERLGDRHRQRQARDRQALAEWAASSRPRASCLSRSARPCARSVKADPHPMTDRDRPALPALRRRDAASTAKAVSSSASAPTRRAPGRHRHIGGRCRKAALDEGEDPEEARAPRAARGDRRDAGPHPRAGPATGTLTICRRI